MKISVLTTARSMREAFAECCQHYETLDIAVAWFGDPRKTLPYDYLATFSGRVHVLVGTAFNQTHPDCFDWLKERNIPVRVFRTPGDLFHPKVYLFTTGERYALLVGSSNLTYCGFGSNVEVNVLIEGVFTSPDSHSMHDLRLQLARWASDEWSFVPSAKWIAGYSKRYSLTKKTIATTGANAESLLEDSIPNASWLGQANWATFYDKVSRGLKNYEEGNTRIRSTLDAATRLLTTPWSLGYFADIERRRVILGKGNYAALGHVGASGAFQHLIANGTQEEYQAIVRSVNTIANLTHPVDWAVLERALRELTSLGPTVKVWSRVLCIVRPDLFCTVASNEVRTNLSEVLKIAQSHFQSIEGYVTLLQLIHESPWFNSPQPSEDAESRVWARRVAHLDAVFYQQ